MHLRSESRVLAIAAGSDDHESEYMRPELTCLAAEKAASDKLVTVRVPLRVLEQIDAFAEADDRTRSSAIMRLLKLGLAAVQGGAR